MDDPNLDPVRHAAALRGLRRLNRISGVAGPLGRVLTRQLERMPPQHDPWKVLDVASGSGDLPIQLARAMVQRSLSVDWTLCDISPVAAETQTAAATEAGLVRSGVSMKSMVCDILDPAATADWSNDEYDVAMCSLFVHHLDRDQAVKLLRVMGRLARNVIICDLQRSRLNLTLVNASARLMTRSDVVHFDADASVRGALTLAELRELIDECYPQRTATVRRLVPCRMIAVVNE